MSARAPIIAGKTVILVNTQDNIDRGLKTIKNKLNKFSADLGKLGSQGFAGGLLGSLLNFTTLKQFKEFDDRILFLKTKLKTTDFQLGLVVAKIRQLGKATSFTAQEVADGATILAQAGLNAKETIDALEPTLDLARGAQISLSESGAVLANTMRSFGMETTKANEVASQFLAAARLGTLDVLDLKESIKEVLGTVRNLNIDLPTTLALLTQMASRSLKGTKAGTSLNTALLNLAAKSQSLSVMGIKLGENLDSGKFIQFLEQLYGKLKRLGNLKRTAVLQSLFNIRGARAITALDEIKQIIELQRQIRNAGNEARWAAKVMDSGFGGSLRIATSAVQDLAITLGEIQAGPIKKLLDMVPGLGKSLDELALKNRMLTLGLLAIPPGLLAMGAGFLTLSFLGGKLAGVIGGLASSLSVLGRVANRAVTANLIALFRIMRGGGMTKALFGKKGIGNKAIPLGSIGKGLSSLGAFGKNAAGSIGSSLSKAGSTVGSTARGGASLIGQVVNDMRRMAKVQRELNALKTVSTSRIYDKEAAKLKSLVGMYNASVAAQNKSAAASRRWTAVALDQVAAQDRQLALQKQVGFTGPKYVRKSRKRVLSMGAFRSLQMMNLIKSEGNPMSPDFAANKADFHAGMALGERDQRRQLLTPKVIAQHNRVIRARAISMRMQARLVEHAGTLQKKVAAIRRTGGLAKVGQAARGGLASIRSGASGFLDNLLSGAGTMLRGAGRGIMSGASSILKADHIRNLAKVATTAGRIGFAFLRAANAVRRFVFSLNGMFLIAELLIMFGHKIDFLRNGFEMIGKGLSKAFGEISKIGTDVGPVLSVLGAGFKELFSGNGEGGLGLITASLTAIANIIGIRFGSAWQEFKTQTAPILDWLSKALQGIWEVLKLIGSSFSGIGSALGQGGKLFPEGSGISGILEKIFSLDTLKSTFEMMGIIIKELADVVIQRVGDMYNIIAIAMRSINQMALGILQMVGGLLSSDRVRAILGGEHVDGMLMTLANLTGPIHDNIRNLNGIQDSIVGGIKAAREQLDQSFNNFTKRLEEIFGTKQDKNQLPFSLPDLQAEVEKNRLKALQEAEQANRFANSPAMQALAQFQQFMVNPAAIPDWNQIRMSGLQSMINDTDNPNKALRLERQLSLIKRREQKRLIAEEMKDAKQDYKNELKQNGYMEGGKNGANLARARYLQRIGRGGIGASINQISDASGLFAALAGDFQTTSRNSLKLQGKTKEDKQLDALNSINNQLGGDAGPYLKQIVSNTNGMGVLVR